MQNPFHYLALYTTLLASSIGLSQNQAELETLATLKPDQIHEWATNQRKTFDNSVFGELFLAHGNYVIAPYTDTSKGANKVATGFLVKYTSRDNTHQIIGFDPEGTGNPNWIKKMSYFGTNNIVNTHYDANTSSHSEAELALLKEYKNHVNLLNGTYNKK